VNPVVRTDRLLLRPPTDEDIAPLFHIQGDPAAMKYTICTRTREETGKRLREYEKGRRERGFAPWTVVHKAEGKVIGWGGLTVDPYDPGWGVEIIYYFHPGYWGRGLGTELVRVSVEKGFGACGLAEIHAFAHPENRASKRVLEKNGFAYQCFENKIHRNHYLIKR
jgi:ribosomal-protein-alanine N-acetyltransferase